MSKPITPGKIAVLGLYSMTPTDRDRIACAIATGQQDARDWVYMSPHAVIIDLGFNKNPHESLRRMGLSDLILGNVATALEQGIDFLNFTAYIEEDEEYEGYKSRPWDGS